MMKSEQAISELLMKCDEKGIQLPENSWESLREAIAALLSTKHEKLGYLQIPKAVEHLAAKFGVESQEAAAVAPSPRVARTQKRTLMQDMPKRNRRNLVVDSESSDGSSSGQAGRANAMSPVASSKKKKYGKKSRLQEQVEANPATRDENQSLVNQLVQLGEYEMNHGKTQRGLARLRAAKEIRDSNMVVTSGAQARQLERVGASVATKIDQLLNEGLAAAISEYEGDGEAMPVEK